MLKVNTDDGNDKNELFLRNDWSTKDHISRGYRQKFSQTFDNEQAIFDTPQTKFAEPVVGLRSNEGAPDCSAKFCYKPREI